MKNLLTILFASFILAGCSKPEIKIHGTVAGMPDKTGVFLVTYEDREFKVQDSILLKGGKFSFSVKTAYPQIAYIGFSRLQDAIPFILEKGDINIECDFDSVTGYTISGTPSNDLLEQYYLHLREFNADMDSISRVRSEHYEAGDSLMLAEATEEARGLHGSFSKYQEKFIRDNNSSPVAAYLISQTDTYGFSYQQMDSLLSLLDPAIEPNKFTDELKRRRDVLESVSPGKPAPDFSMPSPDGKEVSLSSLKGKYVLIDFWAAWCMPCMAALPKLTYLHDKYKDGDFTIFGVSLDTDRDHWTGTILDYKMTWPQVSQLNGWHTDVLRIYEVSAIPHTVLVDKEGTIIGTNLTVEEIDKYLEQVL